MTFLFRCIGCSGYGFNSCCSSCSSNHKMQVISWKTFWQKLQGFTTIEVLYILLFLSKQTLELSSHDGFIIFWCKDEYHVTRKTFWSSNIINFSLSSDVMPAWASIPKLYYNIVVFSIQKQDQRREFSLHFLPWRVTNSREWG